MAAQQSARSVEQIIDYTFQAKRYLLLQALTAAGAVEEDWDGNRRLSQLGTALTEFLFTHIAYEADRTRGVMLRLGIFRESDETVNPAMLSRRDLPSLLDLPSFAKALLHPDTDIPVVATFSEQAQIPVPPTSAHCVHFNGTIEEAHAADILAAENSQNLPTTPLNPGVSSKDQDFGTFIDFSCFYDTWNGEPVQTIPGVFSEIADSGVQKHCQASAKRRAPPVYGPVEKRRTPKHTSPFNLDDTLATYLCEEAERCKRYGCAPPDQSFFTPAVKATIRDLGEAESNTLTKIWVYIASPYSIVALRELLQNSKERQILPEKHTPVQLSKAERFSLIQRLNKHIAYAQLLRRYHVLELFKDCGGPGTPSGTRYVLTTQSNFGMSRRRPGNPMNLAEAEVTTRMMQEMHPEIRSNSDEYQVLYRVVRDIRKLGRRLYALETTFGGRGILGLMLGPGAAGQPGIGISDKMILSVSDSVFSSFVEFLDKHQGSELRELSAALSAMIDVLLSGSPPHREPFKLETFPPSEILRYPKGFPGLLSMLN
ncbi:hypothetical protein DDE82_008855 [Stemphylium lycopersici]|uniref:Uncharacterized protein n=1 Tax=Stemphylium lycopersici TaxID=183478 RepID=A0A364MRP6_STELY|nr:hypothetical protein DDE82_008855 [Stemphylium lycopersici]RAR00186.1 hypothetical protein DDE83_009140 [Stemphylium lycopersici]